MPVVPDEFIVAILKELVGTGFVNTAREIAQRIAEGENGKELSVEGQERICADVMEHNIVWPYRFWEKILEMRTGVEAKVESDTFLLLQHAEGKQPLGSVEYAPFIRNLFIIIQSLRAGPPPKIGPGSGSPTNGGDPKPDAPAPTPRPPRPRAQKKTSKSGDAYGTDGSERKP